MVGTKVARVWAYRKRIEYEAGDQFAQLAQGLKAIGAEPTLSRLAQKASDDELRHAVLCQKAIDLTDPSVRVGKPNLGSTMGPLNLDLRKRVLYASVAVGCVTETLSTALLLEMQKLAEPKEIRETIHSILEDEITHSRIGWATLAHEANYNDVSWLSEYIPAMLGEAMQTDVTNMTAPKDSEDLSAWGILPVEKAQPIMRMAVEEILLPGLERFGVEI